MLRGLGLELACGAEVRHERAVHDERAVATHVVAELADGLQERQALDVADRATDLRDDDVHLARLGDGREPFLDRVRDVRDDLDGVAQVVAGALAAQHVPVQAPGADARVLGEVLVDEALVVAEVEVGLGAVGGDEHLAVLVRAHRARVDVEVGVELLDPDPQAACLEQPAERRGGDALAERGDNAARHEDVSRAFCGGLLSAHGGSLGCVSVLWTG